MAAPGLSGCVGFFVGHSLFHHKSHARGLGFRLIGGTGDDNESGCRTRLDNSVDCVTV
jgi:hypothetical protein